MSRVAALLLLGLAGCAGMDENVRESAETVLTLQRGTISQLKAQRGTGPFVDYEIAPDEMLEIVREAAAKARGLGDREVRAIFVSPYKREVVAKEREPDEASSTEYDGPFRTAMVATVHAVPGRPDQSRLEIHAMQRGPFHRGVVQWTRDMPGWIDEVLAEREQRTLKQIP